MKISAILYGCVECITADAFMQQQIIEAITRTFRIKFSQIVGHAPSQAETQMSPEITVTICWYQLPAPRTFIADVTCDGELEENIHRKLVEVFGKLWTEYVRTFIDSGGLIAIRMADSTAQYKWSPHGAT